MGKKNTHKEAGKTCHGGSRREHTGGQRLDSDSVSLGGEGGQFF